MNDRIARLQKRLQQDGIDGAFYAVSANMQYFLNDTTYSWQRTPYTGFAIPGPNGHQENVPDCVLYVPADEEPVLFMSYARAEDMQQVQVRKVVDYFCRMTSMMEGYVKGNKFAIGESCNGFLKDIVSELCPSAEYSDAEHYGTDMRAIKDEHEIAVMRELCSFTDWSMGEITKILRPGITNAQVEAEIGRLGYEYGCRELPFAPTVRFYQTGVEKEFSVDGYRTLSTLKPGSSISFDYGFTKNGYCTDFGRTFYSGPAPKEISDAYKYFQEAQVSVIERMKPGDPMTYGFDMIHTYMTERGYGDCVRHYFDFDLLGHQVGIDVHEGPWLHNRQTELLQPGMIFTIEPKFWWPDHCFMRIEDMVLITETGAQCLTNFDRELFELPLE